MRALFAAFMNERQRHRNCKKLLIFWVINRAGKFFRRAQEGLQKFLETTKSGQILYFFVSCNLEISCPTACVTASLREY